MSNWSIVFKILPIIGDVSSNDVSLSLSSTKFLSLKIFMLALLNNVCIPNIISNFTTWFSLSKAKAYKSLTVLLENRYIA